MRYNFFFNGKIPRASPPLIFTLVAEWKLGHNVSMYVLNGLDKPFFSAEPSLTGIVLRKTA